MSKVKYYVRIGTLTFGIWVRIPKKWFYSKFVNRYLFSKMVGVGD